MNINDIPAERFIRGLVVSVMEEDRPIIETFTKDGQTLTVAFLRGLPMPYEIFALYMAIKLAPLRSRACIPTFVNGLYVLPDQVNADIRACWGRIDVSAENKELSIWSVNIGGMITSLIDGLYARCKAETEGGETSLTRFCEMVRRIDEDHETSLIDPIPV